MNTRTNFPSIGDIYQYLTTDGQLEGFKIKVLSIKSSTCVDVLVIDSELGSFKYDNWHMNYNNVRLLKRGNEYMYH